MSSSCSLDSKHCLPCEGGIPSLSKEVAHQLNQTLSNPWEINTDNTVIVRDFQFKNYYHVMAFVNSIAWMTHFENHHPDLEVGYNHCKVRYTTHAINGLSENDFICAAKVNQLFQPYLEKYHDRTPR